MHNKSTYAFWLTAMLVANSKARQTVQKSRVYKRYGLWHVAWIEITPRFLDFMA